MKKAVVLLSGGQDSTTALYWAKDYFDSVIAVSVFYGQRHAAELEVAEQIAALAGVEQHLKFHLPLLAELGGSALVSESSEIKGSGGLADEAMPEGLPTSFVPGRNLLLLAIAASVAVRYQAKDIVAGVCQTDYSGYPDCREVFIESLEGTIDAAMPSSCGPFIIHTPLMRLTKKETVEMASKLDGCMNALAYSITCYHGLRPGCGTCPSCELRAKGFEQAGVPDPARR